MDIVLRNRWIPTLEVGKGMERYPRKLLTLVIGKTLTRSHLLVILQIVVSMNRRNPRMRLYNQKFVTGRTLLRGTMITVFTQNGKMSRFARSMQIVRPYVKIARDGIRRKTITAPHTKAWTLPSQLVRKIVGNCSLLIEVIRLRSRKV